MVFDKGDQCKPVGVDRCPESRWSFEIHAVRPDLLASFALGLTVRVSPTSGYGILNVDVVRQPVPGYGSVVLVDAAEGSVPSRKEDTPWCVQVRLDGCKKGWRTCATLIG